MGGIARCCIMVHSACRRRGRKNPQVRSCRIFTHWYAGSSRNLRVAGYGHADKRQMQLMVRALLSMTETPEPADAADALAVALCHLQAEQVRLRYGLPDAKLLAKPRALPLGATPARGVNRLPASRIE